MPAPTVTPEQRAVELRTALLEAGDRLRELRTKPAEERSDNWRSDIVGTTNEITTLDAELRAIERGSEQRSQGVTAALDTPDAADHRSAGAQFVESDAYRERRDNRRTDEHEVRTLLTTSQSDPAAGLWMPRGTPIPPQPREQRFFIRDLLNVQETSLNSVPYIRELNPATNETGASTVAEGVAKPEVTMQFESADAPVRKIAAWVPVTDEIVEDAPTLRGYIDNRLTYMLSLREQAEILNGNGLSPDLRGIRQTSGLQTQAFSVDIVSTLGKAIGKVELVDGDADGIVMHPTDYWTMVTTRSANQFDGGFSAGLPYGSPPVGPWGVRVVRSRAMDVGFALVGAWRLGATLFDRMSATVRVYDQHADYAVLNKQVILAEERVALAVHRPDFFVEADLTA